MHAPGVRGMRVGIDEARQCRLSAKIYPSNTRSSQIHYVIVFPNSEKSAARYGYSFGDWLHWIHRHDVAVVEDQIRFFLIEWEERESSKRA
jgi:hypothetical protein